MTTPTNVPVRLKLRQDTAANWTSVNPTLLAGELGRESDTGKIKIGTGSTAWNSLAYQAWATLPVAVNAGGTGQTTYTNGQLLIGNTTGNTLTKATLTAGSGVAITNGTGSITVAASGIADAQIAADAEIAVAKLADGDARQLLQTDAAGTGVEWASNIDIPGTLDVTGAATFDAAAAYPLGTAALPSIAFTGDTNTGIYSPGADQVAVSTGGTGRLFINSSGFVGVGESNPLDDIHISSANPALVLDETDAGTDEKRWRIRANGATLNFEGVNDAFDSSLLFMRVGRVATSNQTDYVAFHTAAGTERARIDSSGRLLIGANTAEATVSVSNASSTPSLQNAATNQAGSSAAFFNWSTATSGAYLNFSKSKSGTIGTRGQVASGDDLGSVLFAGDDGTNFVISAGIIAQVDGTPGTDDMPGRLLFRTKASGATGAPTERARLTSTGALLVGTTVTPTGAGSGAVVAEDRVVISSAGAGRHQVIVGDTGSMTGTTGTIAFKFKSSITNSARSCYVKLAITNRRASNTPSELPAAEYAFQLHHTSTGVCSLNNATTVFEFTYVYATHVAFADLGSSECTVTLTNPLASLLTGSYKVEVLSHAGVWTLDSVTTT